MAIGSNACREPDLADASETSVLHLLSSSPLAILNELGPSRFSKLLDAIADNELFHELTMID